jgi:hypothetical protein
MTAEKLPRFDIAALKRLAGGAFVRGEAYHREGRVEILAIEPRRVLARVTGTEDYRVNLLGQGETIKGECDCPAFDDYGFCKHMVAGDGYGTFDGAAWLYADVLGEAGLAEYRKLATEAWEKLPRLTGGGRQKPQGDYDGLSGILDRFAELEGDVETRIALRAKDLSSPWKYFELAEFCLRHRSANEALRWAEEGLWTFEDGPSDTRLVLFAANLLMKADRRGKAKGVLKRAFECAPDFSVYTRWREAGGEAARDQALAVVERWAAGETGPSLGQPADLGVKILMYEKRFDMTCAMTRKHRVSRAVMESLARESEADHPREALNIYAERVDELVNEGGNREEATGFVVRMGRLRASVEQMAYVATLKERFGRRRNFVKLLA